MNWKQKRKTKSSCDSDSDDDGFKNVLIQDNHIYFYGDVNREKCNDSRYVH